MRADKYFAEKFGSRTRAADALKRGLVLLNGEPLAPDGDVNESDEESFTFLVPKCSYVSNGGYKLARGLDVFGESAEGLTFVDLGASTGGFCDCLLQRGAAKVYCVDVGENQLDSKLAKDPRVIVMDNTNARYLRREQFSVVDAVVSDLSFISLKLVLPVIAELLNENGKAFLLFKPQFECGGDVGKSGIVPLGKHKKLLSVFYDEALGHSLAPVDIANAPIQKKKNIEYIIFLRKQGFPLPKNVFLWRSAAFNEERF